MSVETTTLAFDDDAERVAQEHVDAAGATAQEAIENAALATLAGFLQRGDDPYSPAVLSAASTVFAINPAWWSLQIAKRPGRPARQPDFAATARKAIVSLLDDAGEDSHQWLAAVENARRKGERRVVVYGPNEYSVVSEFIEALAEHPRVYQRGGKLAHIVASTPMPGEKVPSFAFSDVGHDLLRPWSTEVVDWRQFVHGELRSIHPPTAIIDAALAWKNYPGVREVLGFSRVPVLRRDGSIASSAGYDPRTKLYVQLTTEFPPVAEHPTHDDAVAALATLKALLADFPFNDDASRSAALAMLMTPIAMHAYEGSTPMMMVEASTPGSGKTLLCDVAFILATGSQGGRRNAPQVGKDGEVEMSKIVLTCARAGASLLLFDNAAGAIGWSALDSVLTGSRAEGRLLGTMDDGQYPFRPVVYITGNNLSFVRNDLTRRVLRVRLVPTVERPEAREDITIADLRAHVLEHRGELVAAMLTVLRAFILAGSPSKGLPPWGSYESFSQLVRGALVWCGEVDPIGTVEELRESADTEHGPILQLMTAWEQLARLMAPAKPHAVAVSKVLQRIVAPRNPDAPDPKAHSDMRDALQELFGVSDLPSPRTVGTKLRALRGRIVGGRTFESSGHGENGVGWYVRRTSAYVPTPAHTQSPNPDDADCTDSPWDVRRREGKLHGGVGNYIQKVPGPENSHNSQDSQGGGTADQTNPLDGFNAAPDHRNSQDSQHRQDTGPGPSAPSVVRGLLARLHSRNQVAAPHPLDPLTNATAANTNALDESDHEARAEREAIIGADDEQGVA